MVIKRHRLDGAWCVCVRGRLMGTHGIGGESPQHDGREALVQGAHAFFSEQLAEDVPKTVRVLSFRSWGGRSALFTADFSRR